MKRVYHQSRLVNIFMLPFFVIFLSCGLSMASNESDSSNKRLYKNASKEWLLKIQEDIRVSEYYVTWQETTDIPGVSSSWQAPNRTHNLRTHFLPDGICVTAMDNKDRSWVLGLSLIKYGTRDSSMELEPVAPDVEKNRATYNRGPLTEWYVNSELGLEQGFTLLAPPDGSETASSQVILSMEINGGLEGSLNASNEALEFRNSGCTSVIRLGKLKVFDANGLTLPASYLLKDQVIEISIDTINASYPITVDPMIESSAWLVESNQTSAEFGISVAAAGDVNGDGYSDVIVGAHRYDNGESNEGCAFVYYGSVSGPSNTADWTAESNLAATYFGVSVASAGDVNGDGYSDVIVGAYRYYNGESEEGRAFLYYGSASGLSNSADWTAESNQAGAQFGVSVASAGDVNGDGFSDVIIGAHKYDNVKYNEGMVFLYYGSASGLSNSADWTAESNQVEAYLGKAVASAGDVNGDGYSDVIIGAAEYNNGESEEGRAFLYYGSASGLSDIPDWTAESNQDNAQFGYSVASAGDVNGDGYSDVIVGAYEYDNGESDEGRAFIYYGSASGLSSTADWIAESNQDNAQFGYSVASAGDVNGDGYSDVIVGAYEYDNGVASGGKAFLYYGSVSGPSNTAGWTAEPDRDHSEFGSSVASAGDVNGDGYPDIIIGAPRYDNSQYREGMAVLFYGNDDDGDGMLDDWEIQFFGDTSNSGIEDYDNDDLSNFLEFKNYSNPTLKDTDSDGMGDGFEIIYFNNFDRDGTGDFDNDGLTDLEEYQAGTDPTKVDTDSDGMSDLFEITYFGDITRDGTEDFDDDYLTDLEEYEAGTNPTLVDTDSDGMSDAFEVTYFGDLSKDGTEDSDSDGLTDLEEYEAGSNPLLNSSEEGETNYQFERMWPTLPQPWYFSSPRGIAIDSIGNIYVADSDNDRIQKFTSDGIFITKWGNEGSGDGEFGSPQGIAIDSNDFIYVVDNGNDRIQKFTSDGVFITKWGNEGTGDGEFAYPRDIAIDSADNVYVTDEGNNRIQKFTSDGVFITKWGSYGFEDEQFRSPSGIAIDSIGNVCVLDSNNRSVKKFTPEGQFIEKWGNAGYGTGELSSGIEGLAIDAEDNFYIGENSATRIQKFTSDGQYLTTFKIPYELLEFGSDMIYPLGIDIDADGYVWAVCRAWDRVLKFTSDGQYITQWKSHGNGEGEFNLPSSVLVDNEGYVHVVDYYNNRLQKFTLDGQFVQELDLWEGGGGTVPYPYDMAFDNEGYFYLTVLNSNVIKKYNQDYQLVGEWGSSGSGDGEFDNPRGIDIDSNGYIYIADGSNHRIQKFTSDGTFVAKWGSYGSGDVEIYPLDIAIDQSNYIYVADANECILKFTSDGAFIEKWGNGGIYDGEFIGSIRSLSIDSEGFIWVADNGRIQKFTSSGQYIAKFGEAGSGPGEFKYPRRIEFGPDDRLYIADTENDRIQVFGFESDIDNDGIENKNDNCPSTPNTDQENADGDSRGDLCDGCPNDPLKITSGICGCGIADSDMDGDSLADCEESGYGTLPNDSDTDDDGLVDGGEIYTYGTDPTDSDTDNDGIVDGYEVDILLTDPNDTDTDGDGIQDGTELGYTLSYIGADTDTGVFQPDFDPSSTTDPLNADTDNDNISDGLEDINLNGEVDAGETDPCVADSDGDGTLDGVDNCPNDPSKTEPGQCGCGAADIDSDSDGTSDCNDNCPSDPNKTEPGQCGCGLADTDADSDGIPDCNDNCPDDPNKTEPGQCGCGVADTDSDSDGTPDCNDIFPADPNEWFDTDGDGIGNNADTDDDNDEMPDEWEEQYGLNPLVDNASEDPDSDGYTNSEEYENGTDPTAVTYLVTDDPMIESPNWTAESDQADSHFGSSVATAGDVNGDGYSDIIVAATGYENGDGGKGRVFVYYGTATGLSSTPAWTAESDADIGFGSSVGTAGDVNGDGYSDIIIGAPEYSNEEEYEGIIYIYYGSASGLSSIADWTMESNHTWASFGRSVATAGDVNGDGYSDVIVGVPTYAIEETATFEGRVFVYYGSASGLSSTPDWTADPGQNDGDFGRSVACAGDVNGDGYSDVIVGSPLYHNGEEWEGRALVYYGSSTGLGSIADWTAESNQLFAGFGSSVATAGDVNKDGYADVIVGNGQYSSKSFVYYGSATGLNTIADWYWEFNQIDNNLNPSGWQFITPWFLDCSVSTAGDVNGDGFSDVVIGYYKYNSDDYEDYNEGHIFVYYGSSSGLGGKADWIIEQAQTDNSFGYSVAPAGDINDDGYFDIIIGAPFYDNGEDIEGRVFVYYGSAIDDDTDNDLISDGIEKKAYSDSNDSDTDDDGIPDGDEDTNYNGVLDSGETDPCNNDTDEDGMPDGWEVYYGLNPIVSDGSGDLDNDNLSNLDEYLNGTNSSIYDTDEDGMPDGWEVYYGLDPIVDDAFEDNDSDGVINIDEYNNNWEPTQHQVNQPILYLPFNGEDNVSLTPELETESFSSLDTNDPHAETRWQISTDFDFSDASKYVLNVISEICLTSLVVPESVLQEETTYYWRVKFFGDFSGESMWSDPFSFTTVSIENSNDTDQNGIPDDQEDNILDMDNDGNPDINQSNIKSINTVVGNAQVGVKASTNVISIDTLKSINPDDIPETDDKPKNLPIGLISFKLRVANSGDIAEVVIYLSEAAADESWYKYDTINGWQEYSEHSVFDDSRRIVTLELKDGGFGDCDGTENSVIVDPSGYIADTGTSGSESEPPGSESADGGGGGCLIATAAYGSPIESHIKIMREFRDSILLNSSIGRAFVRIYYIYSPPIAEFIARHPSLRAITRVSLLPIVGASWVALRIGLVYSLALMLFLVSCLFGYVNFLRKCGCVRKN